MSPLTLVLLRHAEAEQQGPPTQGDHGRPLTSRGVSDARRAGRSWRELGPLPDLVLCSPSMRTVQTWEEVASGADEAGAPTTATSGGTDLGGLFTDVEVWRDRRIYNASPHGLHTVLADVPDGTAVVAIVGHAPGIPALVAMLLAEDAAEDRGAGAGRDLLSTFPTMTVVVLHTDEASAPPAPGSMGLVRTHGAAGATQRGSRSLP